MISFREKLEDYTEHDFIEFLNCMLEPPKHLDEDEAIAYLDELVAHFVKITQHPSTTDLLFYPRPGVPDTSEGILQEVKVWRENNGLPGFKHNPFS